MRSALIVLVRCAIPVLGALLPIEAQAQQGAASAEPARRAESYLELGRVYFDRLNDAQSGEAALRFGLKLAPAHVALRWELAERLCVQNRFDRAVPELFELLALEVSRVDVWTRLAQAFDASGQNAEAHLALGPLAFLGGGSDLQRSTWNSRRARTALAAEGTASFAALLRTLTLRMTPAP